MRGYSTLSNIFLFFLSLFSVFPETVLGRTLNLQQVYTLALQHSPGIKGAQSTIAENDFLLQKERGSFYPQFSLQGDYLRQDSRPGASASERRSDGQTTVALGMQWDLWRGGAELAQLNSSKQQLQLAQILKKQTEEELFITVANSFYQVLMLQKDAENLQRLIQLTERRVREIRNRIKIGKSRPADLLLSESSLLDLQDEGNELQLQQTQAWANLAFPTGLEPQEVTLQDEWEKKGSSNAMGALVKSLQDYWDKIPQRPIHQKMQVLMSISQAKKQMARSEFFPTLSLGSKYYLQREGSSQQGRDWDALLKLNVPLFSGFSSSAQVSATQAAQLTLEHQAQELQQREQNAIRLLWDTVTLEMKRIASAQVALQVAKRSYEVQAQEYNLGLVSNLDVLQALNSYIEKQKFLDRLYIQKRLHHVLLQVYAGEYP